jgi:hypothetical protein
VEWEEEQRGKKVKKRKLSQPDLKLRYMHNGKSSAQPRKK